MVGTSVGDGLLVAAQNDDLHYVGVAHPPLVDDGEGEVDLSHGKGGDLGDGERDGIGIGVLQIDGGLFEGHTFDVDLGPAVGQKIAVFVGTGAGEDDGALVVGAPPRAILGNLIIRCGGHGGRVVDDHEADLVSARAV